MQGARVALFDGSVFVSEVATKRLARAGHEVCFEADDVESARALVANLQDGDIDVAIVGGNLGLGRKGSQEIAEFLHDRFEDLVVVGYSSDVAVTGTDYWAERRYSESLRRIIDSL